MENEKVQLIDLVLAGEETEDLVPEQYKYQVLQTETEKTEVRGCSKGCVRYIQCVD